MTTQATLIRKIRNRVPDIDVIDVQPIRPFVFKVAFSTKGARTFDEVAKDVREVLAAEKSAGVGFELESFSAEVLNSAISMPPYLSLAALTSDQSREGLSRTLVSVVHDLAKVVVEEEPGRIVIFRVAREDGSAPHEFLERVRIALQSIGYAGLPFEVKPVDPNNPHHVDMRRAGFAIPSRNRRIVDYTEADEVTYARRIKRLVEGHRDQVSVVDDQNVSKLYLTPSVGPLNVGAMLPLYDQVYVELPMNRDGATYFETVFGLEQERFVEFCRTGRIVPVFKRNLGHYPEVVWRRWLEDPSLPFVSPREADFLAMRYIWESSPFIRQFRDDTEQLRVLDKAISQILDGSGSEFRNNKWLYDVLSWIRHGAEEFEGIAFHRGSMALGNLSAGGASAHLLAATAPQLFKDNAIADTIAIEGFIASQNIAMAQAVGASLFDNLVLNTGVLAGMVPMFQEAMEVRGQLETRRITELVKALEIHYSPAIPVQEYLGVLNEYETGRVRSLIHDLLSGVNTHSVDHELRDRVIKLNREVAKLQKKDLHISTVDVLGDAVSGAGAVTGGGAYGMVLLAKLLGGALTGNLATHAVASVLDGPAGAAIDSIRGALNRVSPHAIRLFRLRKRLKN
ncbi:hypothetical protein EGT07_25010 [Herbaspirillum sp. HC18]|nr:hypothetical protein EGT07_25010 [Herbaspirillum sp. HC18]